MVLTTSIAITYFRRQLGFSWSVIDWIVKLANATAFRQLRRNEFRKTERCT
ncbi:hypothetical protein FD14_GL000462 [Secundilactobacillus similis DSM 23365 = JCM 2765]|uniref:Uncharacterized protein n=1 Tax=Secundilactobacillus similis DSM 23365 = JCM 2765 TaxID=1423804 RepID=A0A0R2F9G6_9LACO|nr:hypothetical protein FD14_GL000462 [Secundilactobacillus similis DSM 23365 = JCM 2765]